MSLRSTILVFVFGYFLSQFACAAEQCKKTDFFHIQEQYYEGDYFYAESFYANASGAHGYFKSKYVSATGEKVSLHENYERPSRIPISEMHAIVAELTKRGIFDLNTQGPPPQGQLPAYYMVVKVTADCKETWQYFQSRAEAVKVDAMRRYLFGIAYKYRLQIDSVPSKGASG